MTVSNLKNYADLIRFDKPIGWLLLLWPTLWAIWIAANGHPEPRIVIIFVLGVFIMRSAGCVINDFADRDFDGHVERTKNRPIAAGKITPKQALLFAAALFSIALFLVLLLNTYALLLAFIGFALATIYPFLKRYTHLPQVWFGATFSWGIPMAFAATNNSVPWYAWLLFFAASLWPIAYDTMYGMVDREDDLKIGVKSFAILLGQYDVIVISAFQFLLLACLSWLGYLLHFNVYYHVGCLAALFLIVYQITLIKTREPKNCFAAFKNNNWVGLVIFLGLVVNYYAQ